MPNRDQRGRTRAATYARRTLLGRPTLRCWRRSFENVAMVRIGTVKGGMTVPPYVVVWALLIVAWAANFVIRVGFSALLPSIIDELELSYTRASLLASAFFYAYVLMQIPSGLLGDRFGRRRVLLIGLVGGALAAGLTGLAGSLVSLFAIGNQFILATWSPLFFAEVGVTDLARAGSYAALQGIAASLGMVASGWAHDRLIGRGYSSKSVIVAGLAGLTVSMLAMAFVIARRSIPGLAVALFVAAFFCWSIWGAVYALLARLVRPEELGTAFGFSNSISFIGAIVGPTATGWVRDLTGSFS